MFRIMLPRAVGLGLQLGLLVLVIHRFRIEGDAFFRLSLVAAIGFPVHALLPRRFRLAFFIALSLLALLLQLGALGAAWLVLCGATLIAISHLPVRFSVRVALLLLVAALLASGRAGWVAAPWPAAVWPILGSIFMFRLILYMVELEPAATRPPLRFTLGYFFLLPNVVFPLFPVVDFKTFCRTYYDGEALAVYQRGLSWMLRGLIHLLIYRVVYHHMAIDAADVEDVATLVRYLLANFFLYLRVSGLFHLAVGILHLFGFKLPETHQLYYLAPSVTDFWRRANIYWRDFMLKAVYYPVFFRLRGRGKTLALVVSTALVFVATWLLHSYQWFWLRGDFHLSWPDTVFWGVLGLLVVALALRGSTRGRQLPASRKDWTARQALERGASTALTFGFICVLWSVWSSESLQHWLALWSVVRSAGPADLLLVVGVLAVVALLGAAFGGAWRGSPVPETGSQPRPLRWQPVTNVAILLGLVLLQTSAGAGSPRLAGFMESIADTRLNPRDLALLQRGYYENLSHLEGLSTRLWELEGRKPADWVDFPATEAARATGGFPQREIVPDARIQFKESTFSSNRWGMRDRDYDLAKPPGTFRLAILGGSTVMGSGVDDGATFEALVEERLGRELTGDRDPRIELLNFAVAGDTTLDQIARLETQVIRFDPDVAVVTAALRELTLASSLGDYTARNVTIPFDFVQQILERSGIDARTPLPEIKSRLEPHVEEILLAAYRRFAETCRAHEILPVWLFEPQPVGGAFSKYRSLEEASAFAAFDVARLSRLARRAGLEVWDLSDAYAGQDPETLILAPWDLHPNARAHQLLAERLYETMVENQDVLFGASLLTLERTRPSEPANPSRRHSE
jgi:hypothetical protein